jgi:ABC-type phosphate transport system permease subunit
VLRVLALLLALLLLVVLAYAHDFAASLIESVMIALNGTKVTEGVAIVVGTDFARAAAPYAYGVAALLAGGIVAMILALLLTGIVGEGGQQPQAVYVQGR